MLHNAGERQLRRRRDHFDRGCAASKLQHPVRPDRRGELGQDTRSATTPRSSASRTASSSPCRRPPSVSPRTGCAQTALSAFGQGDVRATPLQIAMVSAGIANGGTRDATQQWSDGDGPDSQGAARRSTARLQPADRARKRSATLRQLMVNNVNNGAASNGKNRRSRRGR